MRSDAQTFLSMLRLLFRPTVLNYARLSRSSLPELEERVLSSFFFSSLFFSLPSSSCHGLLSLRCSLHSPTQYPPPPSYPSSLFFALFRWIRSINRNQHRHRDEPSLNHIVQWDLNGVGCGERGKRDGEPEAPLSFHQWRPIL